MTPLEVVTKLFAVLPLEDAMTSLRPTSFRTEAVIVKEHEALFAEYPEVLCGLWLYVDDLERAHTIAQGLDTPTGSWWHAIIHRREADYSNSKYWYRRVGSHAALIGGFEPPRFVDEVAASKGDDSRLQSVQRQEWSTLFDWCLHEAGLS